LGWFTAVALPIPLLLVGSGSQGGSDVAGSQPPAKVLVDRRTIALLMSVSIFYLVVLSVSSVRYMFQSSRTAADLLTESSAYVAPIQGIASLALGRLLGSPSTK
jgi:hypothetical protein